MKATRDFIVKIVLTFTLVLAAGFVSAAPADAATSLFGTQEVSSNNLEPFSKWGRIRSHLSANPQDGGAQCVTRVMLACADREYAAFIESIRGLDRRTQIDEVNAYFNRAVYVPDDRNYGVGDYWATPQQLVTRGGDCEDYAIAKYTALRALGISPSDMRIVVLKDLERHLPHAILVVYHEDKVLALDNNLARVVDTDRLHYYQPLYSINETAWWYHVN